MFQIFLLLQWIGYIELSDIQKYKKGTPHKTIYTTTTTQQQLATSIKARLRWPYQKPNYQKSIIAETTRITSLLCIQATDKLGSMIPNPATHRKPIKITQNKYQIQNSITQDQKGYEFKAINSCTKNIDLDEPAANQHDEEQKRNEI